MCVEVLINGKVCETQGELAMALGGDLIMVRLGELQENACCLCPVDLEMTAEKHGYSLGGVDGWYWKMDKHEHDR